MGFTSISFAAFEQPSLQKWNTLNSNDSSFNDGTGIAGLYKNLLAVDSNPYKFRAYRSTAFNTNGPVKIALNSEDYDTNSNFDAVTNNRYVAPVAGFYHFSATISTQQTSGTGYQIALYKNGSLEISGDCVISTQTTSFTLGLTVAGDIQLAATDYVELFAVAGNTATGITGRTATFMSGHLICRT